MVTPTPPLRHSHPCLVSPNLRWRNLVWRDYVACPRSHTGTCPDPKPTPFLPQEKGQMVRPCPSSLPVCSPDGAEAARPAVPGWPWFEAQLLPPSQGDLCGVTKGLRLLLWQNETPRRLTVACWVFRKSAVTFYRQSSNCQASSHLGKWASIWGRKGACSVPTSSFRDNSDLRGPRDRTDCPPRKIRKSAGKHAGNQEL